MEIPRRTQDERSEQTRIRLLDAAIAIMRRRGYAGLRSAEVSAVAGVSRGGQLHHYPTKDMLVAGALEKVFREARERAEERIRRVDGRKEILDAVVADGAEFFGSDDFHLAIDILMSSGKAASMAGDVRRIAIEQRAPAEESWADKLAATGVPRERARDVVWFLWSVIRGLSVRGFIGHDPTREQRVLSMAIRLADRYLDRGGE